MTGILSLANELIQEIAEQLGYERKVLRAACKQLDFAIKSTVLSHLVVACDKYNLDRCPLQLRDIATRRSEAPNLTRILEIRSLTKEFQVDLCGRRVISKADGTFEYEKEAACGLELTLAEDDVKTFLRPALLSLQRIRKILWNINAEESEWTREAVLESLLDLPSLEDLHIRLPGGPLPNIAFLRLSGLHKIVLSGTCLDYRRLAVLQLGSAIAQCPQLVHVDIDSGKYLPASNTPYLHDLFGELQVARPLNLLHLGLRGWYIRMDESILPHLRSLRSLRLLDNLSLPLEAEDFRLPDDVPTQRLQVPESPNSEIWETLEREKIFLSNISTDIVDDALLSYLASYQSVKELSFAYASLNGRISSNGIAKRFYEEVLPRHAGSIESLCVRPGFDGAWCFSEQIDTHISRCQALSELTMCINHSDMKNASAQNPLKTLLDAANKLPHLHRLSLSPPDADISPIRDWDNKLQYSFSVGIDKLVTEFVPGETGGPAVIVNGPTEYKLGRAKVAGGSIMYRAVVSAKRAAAPVFSYGGM